MKLEATCLDIKKAEERYNVKYIGRYDIPGRAAGYGIDIFYQANPKTELGHSNYLGIITVYSGLDSPVEFWLCDAKRITEAQYPAIKFADGFVLCSRYNYDFVESHNMFLDGGLSYTRMGGILPSDAIRGYIKVIDDHEEFVPYDKTLQEDCT